MCTRLRDVKFRSPQLLLVSGIGPKDTLAEQGITLLADRPGVGQNMFIGSSVSNYKRPFR